jgi:hypothetical protein
MCRVRAECRTACITRGVLGSVLPVIYGNGNMMFQAPGYVTITDHPARLSGAALRVS